ncbi:neuronal acetylcholine receptor subunit alpha-6-like [Haliotis cracherodii]|uniref:neuronal acetylcholine receptor subunit alpha-6-like n=1 Tax=Haliotis cracherodii TaxID=6455 RepID=UPI0039E735E0
MKDFEDNSEFDIYFEDITNISDTIGQNIRITMHLKRRPLFYIFTVLFPVVLLYFLNTFVFLLPSQSGEKCSMAVSVLLSFQLFLSIIRDSLPENSLTVSLLGLYVTLANFTSVVIVVVNILLLKIKDKPPPKWILRMCKDNGNASNTVESGNVHDEEQTRPEWTDIETKLNQICFACFFVFCGGITAVILGMLVR